MVNIPQFIESRRVGYAKIPLVFRIIILTLSMVMSIIGFVLAFTPPPFFDIGVLILLFALSVLSLQFDWAHRLLTYIDLKLKDRAFRKRLFAIVATVFVAGIIVIFYGHIRI